MNSFLLEILFLTPTSLIINPFLTQKFRESRAKKVFLIFGCFSLNSDAFRSKIREKYPKAYFECNGRQKKKSTKPSQNLSSPNSSGVVQRKKFTFLEYIFSRNIQLNRNRSFPKTIPSFQQLLFIHLKRGKSCFS